jgi:hypothetical protein
MKLWKKIWTFDIIRINVLIYIFAVQLYMYEYVYNYILYKKKESMCIHAFDPKNKDCSVIQKVNYTNMQHT